MDGNLAQRQSQVSEQVISLDKAAESLFHTTNLLQDRLASVLRQATPTAKEERSDEKRPSLVPLAEEIQSLIDKVASQTARLENICERLEL